MSGIIQQTVDSETLRDQVREAYSLAAAHPEGSSPFPIGEAFAASVGYPTKDLPAGASDVFTGVSNVAVWAPTRPGMTVLDLGCGGGLDAILAGRRLKGEGRVVGLDFSAAMLNKARSHVAATREPIISLVQAAAESMPFADQSVELAMVNGLFNLNPRRREIFLELARIVKAGGQVAGAELVLREPLADRERRSVDNCFS